MTARENVMLGRTFGSEPTSPAQAARDADVLLARVGLTGREDLVGAQLTYIDQKRVELARALATRPGCSCSTNGSPVSIPPSCRSASR